MFVGVEPVVGAGGFAPEVEGVVFDSEAQFFLGFGEFEMLVEEVGDVGAVVGDGVGDGAELLGSDSVVGFEFDDGESGSVAMLIEDLEGGGEGFRGVFFGMIK